MKKIKETETSRECTWCRPASVRAVWRRGGIGGSSRFACEGHREELRKFERAEAERDSHMSEGDHQSWGGL